jgi:hypothetical protein
MAELEFWRERAAKLGTVYEQLGRPEIKRLLAAMKQVYSIHALQHALPPSRSVQRSALPSAG